MDLQASVEPQTLTGSHPVSQAAGPTKAALDGLAWPGEPTGLAGLAFWLEAGPSTSLRVIGVRVVGGVSVWLL